MTLDANSSFLSVGTCHLGHTNLAALLMNSGVLWTIGNYHVKTYGCTKLMMVAGLGAAIATGIGAT